MNKKNIKFWVKFNGQRGILDSTLDEQRFIAEEDLDKYFRKDAVVEGEFASDEEDDFGIEELYSYDNPREVVYEDRCRKRSEDLFWIIEKQYQTEFGAKADEAYRQLMVDTGWKADWMSERTKMKKRIDECRKADVPCGHLRAEWEKTIENIANTYGNEGFRDMINDWSLGDADFFTLVAEVEAMYDEDDDDDEDDE